MVLRYRTTGPWGSGSLEDLEPEHIDENFYTLDLRIVDLETLPPPAPGIDYFIIDGDQLTVVMEDYTTRGPYTLPTVELSFRGAWEPTTLYFVNEFVVDGTSLYVVQIEHTSALTFDPGAQQGGEDIYALAFTIEGGLPAGGAAGMWLRKASSTDYDVEWAFSPVPTGGLTGQFLRKVSDDDDDTAWTGFDLDEADDVSDDAGIVGNILRWDGTEWAKQQDYPPLTISSSTLSLGDAHIYKSLFFTAACDITVPPSSSWTDLAVGQMIHGRQTSTGGLTFFEGVGVTINGISGCLNATSRRGATWTLYYAGSNVWELWGLLSTGTDGYET